MRCLRSYYCSRECQNIDWHLQHKNLCYKPIRLLLSTLVYCFIAAIAVPKLRTDPLPTLLAVLISPLIFAVYGHTVGLIAGIWRKQTGLDMRGRILESHVVTVSILLFCTHLAVLLNFLAEGVFIPDPGDYHGFLLDNGHPTVVIKVVRGTATSCIH